MPLDDGGYPGLIDDDPPGVTEREPDLQSGVSIGEALRLVREHQGRDLDELAETTRVRRSYLEAIEDLRLQDLPSRPFTLGYIRAYATALGLDPEAASDRFRIDEPILDEPLRAPIGVPDERDPRTGLFMAAAIAIVISIVLWNVVQRAMSASAPPPPRAPEELAWKLLGQAKFDSVKLGEPLPAPVESTIPPLYDPPGLAEAGEDGLGNMAPPADINAATEVELVDLASLPQTFTPKGRVYGGPPNIPSVVTLQARKAAALIIRGADGSVYFARQLSEGEAYKVPNLAGLTIDVSEPQDIQVFVAGQSRGVLPATQVLASKLGSAPAVVAAASRSGPPPAAAAAPLPAPAAAPAPVRP